MPSGKVFYYNEEADVHVLGEKLQAARLEHTNRRDISFGQTMPLPKYSFDFKLKSCYEIYEW